MKMRTSLLLIAVMMMTLASCEKATHRRIASKGEGTVWTIDEMAYSASDDGTVMHDTLMYEVGRFEFRVEKSRFKHGLGTVYRREYVNGAWSIEAQQEFSWSSDDDAVQIIYESGITENITVQESKRNAQHWESTVSVGANTYTRTYFLSRSFDN